jgi:amino acid transporter
LAELISLIIILPLLIFWFWMFWDLTNNDYLPDNSTTPLTWPPSTKTGWMLAFIFLSVFAAFWYYRVEYRNRRL